MMKKIIIGIHGLGNKPPKRILRSWWKKAIKEGLQRIGHSKFFFNFKLVYWADIIYQKPLNPKVRNKKDPYFLDEPYLKTDKNKRKKISGWQIKMINYLEKQLDRIFLNKDMTINYSAITDQIIHRYFKELETYYSTRSIRNTDRPAKEVIRECLMKVLEKYKKKNILLIAHSMGSIIAYDVLSYNCPAIKINTFVTIGSPLGLPIIVHKIYAEQKQKIKHLKKIKAPDSILNKWYNLSDPYDKVALDHTLSDDFKENIHKVKAIDLYVHNDYSIHKKQNPHNCLGYLRLDETARIIHHFLTEKEMSWFKHILFKIRNCLTKNK